MRIKHVLHLDIFQPEKIKLGLFLLYHISTWEKKEMQGKFGRNMQVACQQTKISQGSETKM